MADNFFKKLRFYSKIWWMINKNSFLIWFTKGKLLALFLIGKLLRFAFFFAFMYFLLSKAGTLAGYSGNQIIFFFLTFNLIDIVSQFFFRQVYSFRPLVVSGDFDFFLLKPINVLFRSLLGGADVIDLITIPPLMIVTVYIGATLNPTTLNTVFYILLLLNGFVIAAAFHIAVLALGIITLEVDHLVMIYRDLTNLGRLPVEIYKEPLKSVLTYFLPVGIMMTLPVRVLIGLATPSGILTAFAVGIVAIFASLKFWNFALRKYTSASS